MSNRATTRIQRVGTFTGVEDPKPLLRRRCQTRTNNRQVAFDEYHAQVRATSPTNMEPECEDTFHAVANALISEEQPADLKNRSVAPPARDQLLMRVAITRIPFHLEEAMIKLGL